MTPFYTTHRDLAFREMRTATMEGDPRLPDGEYGFLELYCNEDDCDCRRVFVWVLRPETGQRVWATIGFGWEKESFYRKWTHGNREFARELMGAQLEPMQEQSELAGALLALFKEVLQDREYVERLTRHYALHKRMTLNE